MQTPEQIAAQVVDGLSFSSNRMVNGRLVGEQYFAAQAIAEAIKAERDRCAEIAHSMARALVCRTRTNAADRRASEFLAQCRDKIRNGI